MEKNRYIANVKEIAKLAYREGVDWSVAVDMWDTETGEMDNGESGRTELRHAFYNYVGSRKYDENGDETGAE